jgi:hypothetical protein
MSAIYGPGGDSPGTNLNRLMDSLGFAEQLGDVYGASLDAAIGNNMGVARNLMDAFSPFLKTSDIDRMMAGGFPPPGFCNRPVHDFAHHFHRSVNQFFNPQSIERHHTSPGFEERMMTDPGFRTRMESRFGGEFKWDGKADGNFEIAKPKYHPCLPFQNHIHQHCKNMLGRLLNPTMPNQILNNLANFLGSLPGMPGAGGPGGPGGAGQAGGAGQPGGAGQAGGAGSDAGAILRDPNLSFEEKLFQFMLMTAEKKQDQILKKAEELDKAKEAGQAGGAGGGKKAGGPGGAKGGGKASPVGKIGNLVGGAMQGIMGGLVGGPMGSVMGNQTGGAGQGQGGAGGTGKKGSEETLTAELARLKSQLETMMKTISKIEEGSTQVQNQILQGM